MIRQNYDKTQVKIQRKTKAPPPSLIFVASGDSKGEINLLWEPVRNANSYVIQRSRWRKGALRWHYVDIIDKSSYTDTNLKSGIKYCFRVASITSKGQSLWSTQIQKKAP